LILRCHRGKAILRLDRIITCNECDLVGGLLLQIDGIVGAGGSGSITWVAAPERAWRLRILAPELARDMDIATSPVVPADRVIAVDGPALFVATDPAPDIVKSEEAVLHMSDVPLEIVSDTGPTTADPVRSLWQTASVAARVIHEIDFVKRRSTAVAYLDGASW
jgi:hypothetical protein